MRKTFGIPNGDNHITTVEAGTNGKNVPSLLAEKKGIYIMIANYPGPSYFGATGHADIIENAQCPKNCYFAPKGGINYIDLWILE
ncbi:hypothetical protein CHX27_05060 [Flavobacterium aurantiibacter]|uniref:Uncharacterized protein n=1 Tax=Flavobacterium aurantiibacter TaxID=2023067 RepID=A0A255ZX61_9FLAO|nr:hypothetical protein [Flavobacterium aurantiibacter]OYQ46083.1 hypothetical protein CHX27_05060 [Flavobacterium aurantiibacter]